MNNCPECGELISFNATKCDCGWISKKMKVVSHLTIADLLKSQAEYYGRKISDGAIRIYEEDLQQFRFSEIKHALDEIRKNGAEKMPLANHIKQKIRELYPVASINASSVNENEFKATCVMTEIYYRWKNGECLNMLTENYTKSMNQYNISIDRLICYFNMRDNILSITGKLIPWESKKYENVNFESSKNVIEFMKAN